MRSQFQKRQGNRKHPLRRENFHDTFEVRGAHRLDLGRKFRCARAHLGAHIFYTGKCTHFLKHFLLVLWLNFGAHRGAHYILCWKIHTIFKTFSLSFAVKFWCAPRCAHILCWKMHTFFKTFSLSFAVKFRCQISKDSSRFDIFARHGRNFDQFWENKLDFFSPKFTFRQGIWSEILTNSDKKKHSNFDILARYMVGMLTNFEGKKAGFAVKFWCALHFMLEKAHFWKSTPRNNVCVFLQIGMA